MGMSPSRPRLTSKGESDQLAAPREPRVLSQTSNSQQGDDISSETAAGQGDNPDASQEANGSLELSILSKLHCAYHDTVLKMHPSRITELNMGVFDRFMAHNAGEQYALFIRPDNGELSTFRSCTCLDSQNDSTGVKANKGREEREPRSCL
jgi:hypothetical protein